MPLHLIQISFQPRKKNRWKSQRTKSSECDAEEYQILIWSTFSEQQCLNATVYDETTFSWPVTVFFFLRSIRRIPFAFQKTDAITFSADDTIFVIFKVVLLCLIHYLYFLFRCVIDEASFRFHPWSQNAA